MNSTALALTVCLLASAPLGHAAPTSFDFKDPKGVNNATFKLDAPLEAIQGTASGVSGKVSFDPANPGATQGRIVIATSSLHVPNPIMKEHMLGDQWMDATKHGEITFEAKELSQVSTQGEHTTAQAKGTLTVRGVSKEMTIPVKLTYLKDKLAARTNGQMKGDLLVIRSSFSIQRADFGINPKAPEDKVASVIEISLSVAGAAPR